MPKIKPDTPPKLDDPSGLFGTKTRSFSMGYWATRTMAQPPNASAYLETVCRRYDQLMYALVPRDWSLAQWAVAVLALREWRGMIDYESWKVVMGWAHRYQAHALKVYEVDPVDVARTMMEGGEALNIAVCEAVDRYWWMKGRDRDHADRIEALGLVSRSEVKAWKKDNARRKRLMKEADAEAVEYAAAQAEQQEVEDRAAAAEYARRNRAHEKAWREQEADDEAGVGDLDDSELADGDDG